MNKPSLSTYSGKQLLSYLRQGDFAHAGETEAIDLVMMKFKKSLTQKILDVGCGLGGTAQYIQDHGWGTVNGLDIEPTSIEHARKHYSNINFYLTDVESAHKLFSSESFDIF